MSWSALAAASAAAAPAAQSPAPAAVSYQTVLPQPAVLPPDPAIPSSGYPPAAAGHLDAASLPSTEQTETLLHVTSPGRFAIAAHSPSGATLQLVDMLTGPSDTAGIAGVRDGRIDPLLDVGVYKLRVTSAQGATGNVALALTAFHDAAPPAALPQPGRLVNATLADGEQRGYWLNVPPSADGVPNIRIEAAGRSLGDLRLWRDGRDLVDMMPAQRRIEPRSGHPLTDLTLIGRLEPGTYLLTAYGGPSLPWTDNDAAQPFLLRSGASPALAEGWTGGVVGPFGSEVFAWPAIRGNLRLDLPAPAPASLIVDYRSSSISVKSRAPSTEIGIPSRGDGVVELRAAADQAYTLRLIEQPARSSLSQAGTYFVAAATRGLGGDEPPPAVMLERYDAPIWGMKRKPPAIIASIQPELADGWHARFNLHGYTSLPFQAKQGGEVAWRISGVDVTTFRNMGMGGKRRADLPPGYFSLDMEPRNPGVEGIVDVIIAKPNQTPALQRPLPADPVLPLGVQTVAPGQELVLSGTEGPGISLGLIARPVPVALMQAPLTVTLNAGAGLSVPVQIAPGGRLAVSEVGVGDIAARRVDGPVSGQTTVEIAPADHPRTVVLSWRRDPVAPPPIPAPVALDQVLAVQAGTAAFFDLRREESREFALTVPQGGLYRVETLGRLHTSGRLSTPFITRLAAADGNGVGLNMLMQSVLRAGRYRVNVSAIDSAGHLGLLASPAPLLTGATLLPDGSVRASLPAGTGVEFPIDITGAKTTQTYHLDVYGLGAAWTGRLEDAEGWPITTPGPLDGTERALRPGHYRLVVEPGAVARKVVARLTPLIKPADIVGHGPHDLPFATRMTATWREPEGRDQPRTPDVWRFALAGQAQVTLRLGDGMVAMLRRADGDGAPIKIIGTDKTPIGPGGDAPPQGRRGSGAPWKGRLEAGAYVLEATSLGRNDRLGYGVQLDTDEVQPGLLYDENLGDDVPFVIAQPRVVSLTTFGTAPVRAELRREDGTVIGRYGAREDDWNIAVSRLLPAGRYILNLQAAVPPSGSAVYPPSLPVYNDAGSDRITMPSNASNDDNAASDDRDDEDDGDDNGGNDASNGGRGSPPSSADGQKPQTDGTRSASDTRSRTDSGYANSNGDSDGSSDSDSYDNANNRSGDGSIVALQMALPDSLPPRAAPGSATVLSGRGVHVLTLPAPDAESLLVARAASPASLVLALERQSSDGGNWQTVAISEGRAPTVAAPADSDTARPWRFEVWTVDGGPEPIQLAARAVKAADQGLGSVSLAALDGMPGGLAVARVDARTPGPLSLTERPHGLLAGGWNGHALNPVDGDTLLLPDQHVWLLAPQAGKVTVRQRELPVNEPITLSLQAGLTAPLPALKAADGRVLLWRADSGLGQPGLGADMGVAPSSSLALGQGGVVLRSAADNEALRLRLTRLEPALAPARALTEPLHTVLEPGAALPVTVPAGDKRISFDLAPGTAGITGWKTPHADIAWAGDQALTRGMSGNWTDILLVNTGAAPAPVSLSWQAEPVSAPLRPGSLVKRFFGAAGSFEIAVNPAAPEGAIVKTNTPAAGGPRISVAGDADLTLIGADGTVRRGRSLPLNGSGQANGSDRVIVRHGVGAMALWVQSDGHTPWPQTAAQAVTAPAHLALSGPSMSLALTQTRPVLLHATTTSPVLIRLKQTGGDDAPALFAAGASFHRVMAAGTAELQLYSPQDGPLSGSIDLVAEPIVPVQEGLGQPVSVAPGGGVVFGFTLTEAATIGVGVRADPDRAEVRLLDASGAVLGEGVAQLRALPAGQYLIEARIKPDAPTTTIRPAVIGITPRGNGPPPDVAAKYLALVGMKLQEEKK